MHTMGLLLKMNGLSAAPEGIAWPEEHAVGAGTHLQDVNGMARPFGAAANQR